MNSLYLDDPRTAFRVGYIASRGNATSPLEADEGYLSRILSTLGDLPHGECAVVWPSEPSAAPSVVLPGRRTALVPPGVVRAFSQGAFSALIAAIFDERGNPRICLRDAHEPCLTHLLSTLGISMPEEGAWFGVAALDVLGRVLDGSPEALPSVAAAFEYWRVHIAHLTAKGTHEQRVLVKRVHPEAQLPAKDHVSDSGYDLTLIYEKKRVGKTVLYGTGLIVEAPFGWYFDVVPRSSIIKRGYILANSVGVIDRSYRGEIFVPLIKIDDDAPDLTLPARVAQLIPRPILHFPVAEARELSATRRGAGGFGSTGE